MFDRERLIWILDVLLSRGLIHEGQKKDVLNRGDDQARHIMLDKRAELRRLLGKRRVTYKVSEIEVVASFRFRSQTTDAEEGLVTERVITRLIAIELGLRFVEIDPLQLDFKLVTESFGGPFSERHLVIAIEETPEQLTVAMSDPWNREVLEQITLFKQKRIRPVMTLKSTLIQVIAEFHGFRRSMREAERDFGSNLPDLGNLEQLTQLRGVHEMDGAEQPVVQAVWYILNYAFDHRASDIHIEPKREEATVRLRIDGVFHTIHRLPKLVFPAIISRIKTLSRMDIAERRRPQDGRFKTSFRDQEIELRVSTVPTAFGEKMVIRVFDPGVLLQDLGALGFFRRELLLYERFINASTGLILVTGPTGSGKTTTLYSTLQHIASPRLNICTIEDPIEMVHEAFNQMPIHRAIGFDYAAAIRHVLRQDPDVIMIGEVRDPETAQSAVQAALTGHLVITTLHTNDAPSAVTRMIDLGVQPYLLSSVLLGVIAQRLVRKICPHCATDDWISEEQALALGINGADGKRLKVKVGKGCVRCRGTGYKGRTGLMEVMPMTPRLGKLVATGAPSQEVKREALNDGMLTLRDYGIKKLGRGETTVEEIMAATDDFAVY
ncbi:MAG: type II/IV secretion system protein [Deltaproteobacteria bacterium]|nr:type II/IV secretion system protein [Deltaproteobacteria bacterium]